MKTAHVSVFDFSEAIDAVDELLNGLDRRLRTLLERMADEGIKVASARFGSAQYDGPNDVTVRGPVWISDTRLAISAEGRHVTFIEFGAGALNPGPHHPKAAKLGMIRGKFGKGRGMREKWYYKGSASDARAGGIEVRTGVIETRGNGANMGMYEAGKAMRDAIARLAGEVFGG